MFLYKKTDMALSTFVKISSVSNLSDARYCSGMGVDLLGFGLNPAKEDAVSPELFLEISNWVSGVRFVGEFDHLSSEDVVSLLQQLPLDFIETTNLEEIEKIGLLGKPLIFKLEPTTNGDLEKIYTTLSYLDELVEYVVINCKNPDLYEGINKLVSFYQGRLKLIRAFDISVETVTSVKGYVGIQLSGTKE